MTIGEKIKKYRKHNKLTQKQLAEKVCVGVASIQRYERDELKPNIGILDKIADIFCIPVTDLLESKKTFFQNIITKLEDLDSQNTLYSISEKLEIDHDLFEKYFNETQDVPESEIIKLVNLLFEQNPIEFEKIILDNFELVKQYHELFVFCQRKRGLVSHLVLRDAKIDAFTKDLKNKLEKYFDLSPSDNTILSKITDLIDYEIYKLENKKEGE
ncbi:helix-turn-helix domain-containing protein [Clostridium saccharoperbutylacetonicum]|uniref:helix-turn-helix domain-containing protein n=1 Tax=Clostridium saccharoperbutylacetonicum TaxID=36745 RepID=UPI0039E7BC10